MGCFIYVAKSLCCKTFMCFFGPLVKSSCRTTSARIFPHAGTNLSPNSYADFSSWKGSDDDEKCITNFRSSAEFGVRLTVTIRLHFPNAVVLNAVGRRNVQINESKKAQTSAKERKRKSAKEHKRVQKGAKERKRAQKSAKERFHVKIAHNQV